MARARTRTIPDGVYEAESYMDDDGIEVGKPVPIKVRVVVKGDEMTVDLTKVSKQVRGFYNSGITTGLCLRAGRLQVPDVADRLSDQRRLVPQPQGDRAAGPHRQRDAAGADALVDDLSDDDRRHACSRRWRRRFPIASSPAITPTLLSPRCTASIRRRRNSSSPISARSAAAGAPSAARTASAPPSASTMATPTTRPTSRSEAKFPLVVERYALVPDSGGAGRHRGGLGVERVVRARIPMTINTQIERAHCRPWGLDGGLEGTGNQVALRRGGTWKTDFPNAKVLVAAAQARRRLLHPFRRRRRLRRSARAAGRDGRRGRAAGLCVGRGGGRALRRGDRSCDACARCRGKQTSGGELHAALGTTAVQYNTHPSSRWRA